MRSATLGQIVAGLNGLLDAIADADLVNGEMQRVGWRGPPAHTPPSMWLNLKAASTQHESGGRIRDRLPFELWFTRPPSPTETDDLAELARLADLAIPIVDAALKRSTAAQTFGVDRLWREGFSFSEQSQADGAGASLQVPALLIPVTAEWPATEC